MDVTDRDVRSTLHQTSGRAELTGRGCGSSDVSFPTCIMLAPHFPEFTMSRGARKRLFWSSDDVRLLRSLAGRETAARIARKLRRTVLAVRFKAHVHQISLALRKTR
jgi:hypothetical protein